MDILITTILYIFLPIFYIVLIMFFITPLIFIFYNLLFLLQKITLFLNKLILFSYFYSLVLLSYTAIFSMCFILYFWESNFQYSFSLRGLIIGLIALFSFDFLDFLLLLSCLCKCVSLWVFLAVDCCFTISLGMLFSVLCGLWNLGATLRGWAWSSEVGYRSSGFWTTRELPTPWNINRWEPSQKSLYQI